MIFLAVLGTRAVKYSLPSRGRVCCMAKKSIVIMQREQVHLGFGPAVFAIGAAVPVHACRVHIYAQYGTKIH